MNAAAAVAGTVIIVLTVLAAYTLGRRIGITQGLRTGLALAPLQMRQQSLLRGRCLLCGTEPDMGHAPADNNPTPDESANDPRITDQQGTRE